MNTRKGRPKKVTEESPVQSEIEKAEKPADISENQVVAGKNKTIGELRTTIAGLEEKVKSRNKTISQDKKSRDEMEARLVKAGSVKLGILQSRWHNWEDFEVPVINATGVHQKDENDKKMYETIKVEYDDSDVPVYVVKLQTRTTDGQNEPANGLILIYIDEDTDRQIYLNFVDGWTVTNNRKAGHIARKKGGMYSIKPLQR